MNIFSALQSTILRGVDVVVVVVLPLFLGDDVGVAVLEGELFATVVIPALFGDDVVVAFVLLVVPLGFRAFRLGDGVEVAVVVAVVVVAAFAFGLGGDVEVTVVVAVVVAFVLGGTIIG